MWDEKKLQKKSEQQQADVHAVHVGVGGNDHAVVTQIIERVFDV